MKVRRAVGLVGTDTYRRAGRRVHEAGARQAEAARARAAMQLGARSPQPKLHSY